MPRDHGSDASEHCKEPRTPARGTVRIRLEDQRAVEILGRLMDISASGFRAVHDHAALIKWQEVYFEHAKASGKARVVWNCVRPESVEIGFLIV